MNSRIRRTCALVLFAFPAIAPAQSSAPRVAPASDAIALAPGDVVRITVWRKPELSGEFVVTANGTVAHPLYREVQIGGIPLAVAEDRLRTFLAKYEANPQFVIEPLLRVAVGGEVRQPNLYSLRPETSISQAVALAGGPTERGRRDRLRLIRQEREIIVDLRRVDASGAGMPIRSGDQIVVERERAVFRDVIAPTVGVFGAIASIVGVILYNSNR
jgi:polysaccharide export outer membrane protein